jgi:hypothetical protein
MQHALDHEHPKDDIGDKGVCQLPQGLAHMGPGKGGEFAEPWGTCSGLGTGCWHVISPSAKGVAGWKAMTREIADMLHASA